MICLKKTPSKFLKATKDYASKFYFAVNKSDLVSEVELAQYIGYCQGVLQQINGYDTQPVKTFHVSAKPGKASNILQIR